MSDELLRDVPCSDESCATVLGWQDGEICEDCTAQIEQQGIATSNEQLTLTDEEGA